MVFRILRIYLTKYTMVFRNLRGTFKNLECCVKIIILCHLLISCPLRSTAIYPPPLVNQLKTVGFNWRWRLLHSCLAGFNYRVSQKKLTWEKIMSNFFTTFLILKDVCLQSNLVFQIIFNFSYFYIFLYLSCLQFSTLVLPWLSVVFKRQYNNCEELLICS